MISSVFKAAVVTSALVLSFLLGHYLSECMGCLHPCPVRKDGYRYRLATASPDDDNVTIYLDREKVLMVNATAGSNVLYMDECGAVAYVFRGSCADAIIDRIPR